MKAIGLPLFISALTVNDASRVCYDYLSYSSCYNTAINDDYVYCYGYGACRYTEITASNTVNCDGYFGCSYSDEVESTSGSIYCDGNYGCYYVDAITASSTVYCDGENGCSRSEDISGNNVYCSGDYACAYIRGDITADNRVYCDGKYGCYRVDDGTISGEYVEATGFWSAYYSNIEATDDVTCGGEYSCYYATINAGGSVKIEASYAAYGATVTATAIVYCDAVFGCEDSTITTYMVYIRAQQAAYAADITSQYVYAYGYAGLLNADITSKDDQSLIVLLYGYNAGSGADIFCLDGSRCYVYCYSDTACNNLGIYYYGELSAIYVYPTDCKTTYAGSENDDGVKCPSFTSSTSMAKEEYKAMRKELFEASDDYTQLIKDAEEKRIKGDKARQKAEKAANEKVAKAEREGEEDNKSNKIFANNHGLLRNEESGIFNVAYDNVLSKSTIMMFVGILIGFLVTFVGSVYYIKMNYKKCEYEQIF